LLQPAPPAPLSQLRSMSGLPASRINVVTTSSILSSEVSWFVHQVQPHRVEVWLVRGVIDAGERPLMAEVRD
jgi:hypothetical protein